MTEHATEMLACIIHDAIYPDSNEDMMTWPSAIFTAANNILAAGYRKEQR